MNLFSSNSSLSDEDTPGSAMSLLERRTVSFIVVLLITLAAAAWYFTSRQSTEMGPMLIPGLGEIGMGMQEAVSAPLFMGMWLAMMVAMMFPTVAPMVTAFTAVARKRGEGALPPVVFVMGYLTVWTAIGLVPLAVFLIAQHLEGQLSAHVASTVTGAVFGAAGLYQFTRWKTTCLRACRTPLGFILSHDFGKGSVGAFAAGVSHGAFCFGCCWALMAVLVVVGMMNLVWMAAIALVFLAEKNWKYGVMLTRVAGSSLVVVGIGLILMGASQMV